MGNAVTVEALQTLPLFDGCAADDLEVLAARIADPLNVTEGEVVCAEGDDGRPLVDRRRRHGRRDGRRRSTSTPSARARRIGELALLDGEPRGATVTAATDMQLHEVDGAAFLDALARQPTPVGRAAARSWRRGCGRRISARPPPRRRRPARWPSAAVARVDRRTADRVRPTNARLLDDPARPSRRAAARRPPCTGRKRSRRSSSRATRTCTACRATGRSIGSITTLEVPDAARRTADAAPQRRATG